MLAPDFQSASVKDFVQGLRYSYGIPASGLGTQLDQIRHIA